MGKTKAGYTDWTAHVVRVPRSTPDGSGLVFEFPVLVKPGKRPQRAET